MSSALLQQLVILTEISSVALVVVLLLRPVLRRLGGAALVYTSWWLLPVALLASLLPHPTIHTPVFSLPMATIVTGSTSGTVSTGQSLTSTTLWLLAWGMGAALVTAWMVWQQIRFVHNLGWLRPGFQGSVYFAVDNRQMGPLLLGLLRPRIVLPCDFASRYTEQEQALILAHEQVHLRRRDVLANTLTCALQIGFWFNPLLHYAANRFRLDQELACDLAVVQQYPLARQAYADAILKTQLFSSGVPLACHWQSHHPLKERILQLSQATPNRTRRRSAKAVLASVTLAVCYSVWATEKVSATGAGSVSAADAPRYQVVVDFKREVPDKTDTLKMIIPLRAGELVHLFPNPQLPVGCTIDLEVNSLPNELVKFRMPFKCEDDNEQREPKLTTKLGQTAKVEIGAESPEVKFQYTIDLTISRWPASTPWPGSKPKS
jgi:beta-lactamase regulating signal transducer with metallopeptidase domain